MQKSTNLKHEPASEPLHIYVKSVVLELNPEPYTLNPEPYNLKPEPCTLNPEPYTLNSEP